MKRLLIVPAVLAAFAAAPARATPPATELARCLADNTTGKERKELARWIFLGMAAHPDMAALSNATAADRDQADRAMADLMTQLLTDRCGSVLRREREVLGTEGMRVAFQSLGQLAMQELMSDPAVGQAMAGFERYVDHRRIDSYLAASAPH